MLKKLPAYVWIIGGILTAGVLYYAFVYAPKKKNEAAAENKKAAINAADAAAYTALLEYIKQQLSPGNYAWFINDVPMYFPGGSREIAFTSPDIGGTVRSKVGRLYAATNELAAGNVDNWNAKAAQHFAKYQSLLATVANAYALESNVN